MSLNPSVSLADTVMGEGRNLTSQGLQNVAVCRARGYYAKMGSKRLPMSPFAAEHTQAGLAFEREIEADPGLLLRPLRRQRPGLLVTDKVPMIYANRGADGKEIKGDGAVKKGREVLRSVKPDCPVLIGQIVLEIEGQAGRPDWILWTGKYWVLVEMKRGEVPLAIHGVQLAFYRELLRLELGIDAPVFSEAFILHCAPGFLYVSRDSNLKQESLDHLMLTAFPLDLLDKEKDRLKEELDLLKEEPDAAEKHFTGACVECSFKQNCYPGFFDGTKGTPLSLIPLPTSDREIIQSLGFESLEEVAKATATDRLREFRNGRSEQIRGLRHRAGVACTLRGFSDWRSHKGWRQKWMAYAYEPTRDDREEHEAWGNQDEHFIDAPRSIEECPEVILCYTEREVRRVKRRLRENGLSASQVQQISFLCLVEEIRENVHLPLVSYTLPEVAAAMEALRADGKIDRIVEQQLKALELSSSWPDSRAQNYRLLLVEQVWKGLLYLEEVCWGRRIL